MHLINDENSGNGRLPHGHGAYITANGNIRIGHANLHPHRTAANRVVINECQGKLYR